MPLVTTAEEDKRLGEFLGEHITYTVEVGTFNYRDEPTVEIDGTKILEWVGNNFPPGDVFDEASLREWALDNGFSLDE